MKYGYFDDSAREYVITHPETPVKWINYIGTLAFGGFVDQTGGALLCAGDPALNRILKYIPQLPDGEPKGETLYLRTRGEDGFKLHSPFFTPTLNPCDAYACHVGLGYQRIISTVAGMRTEVLIFVPRDAPVEIRDITVTNVSDADQEVDLIPLVEYSHFEAWKQFNNADWVPQTMMSQADWEDDGQLILRQYAFMRRETLHNFLTSNHPVDSFESDRSRFLGKGKHYSIWKDPLSLYDEHLSNYLALRGDNIGALMHRLGILHPGEHRRIITQLGQAPAGDVQSIARKYRDPANVDAAFYEMQAFWDTYLNNLTCKTPSAAFNSTVNVHNPRQCYITMNWSRYLSLYQLGLGARGMGFRDSSQDAMGAVMGAPGEVKALLKRILSVQNPDGSAMHQFFPLTMEANEGDSRDNREGLFYGDDHLWAVLAACAYIKETGDYGFPAEEISFYSKTLPLEQRERAPVLEHLLRAVAFTRVTTGQHGLPLVGYADWNDTVNLDGKAESLFNACLYGRALLELIDLLHHLGNEAPAAQLAADHTEMKIRVNEHAWDGEWYIRYFKEDGTPIGSSKNIKGKIFTNAQSWTVFAGFADGDRGAAALDAVEKHLNTTCGIKLSWPGYDHYDKSIGGISTYLPGTKENSGIFLHTNPWVIIAETLQGNGNRAFQYYEQINPAARNEVAQTYEVEPYVYAQNILSDEHPQFGLGRNSWLSGTASWAYQAATQFILGIQPTHSGLRIDPCIPKHWDGFSVTRKFRGTTYTIRVDNPDHVSKGVRYLSVDGQFVSGNRVPLQARGSCCEISVTLGT